MIEDQTVSPFINQLNQPIPPFFGCIWKDPGEVIVNKHVVSRIQAHMLGGRPSRSLDDDLEPRYPSYQPAPNLQDNPCIVASIPFP